MADEDWDIYPDPNCCCERRRKEKKSICTMCWFGEHIHCYDKETPVSEHNHEDLTYFVEGCPKCIEQRQGGAEKVSLAQDADGGFVTPEQHGAAGDGVTDDTAAVQAAVDEAAGEQSPGTATE